MGAAPSLPKDKDVQEALLDTTPCNSPNTPKEPGAPRKRGAGEHFLFLDVQTTNDHMPQLLSLDAVMYSSDDGHLEEGASMSAIIRPRHAYSVLRHMQEVRYHGIPAEVLGIQGKDAIEVVNDLLAMIAQATGSPFTQDHDKMVVVAHSVDGMMSNFMEAARIDETLYPVWNELEALCQQTHDTFDEALKMYPGRLNYTVEHLLAHLDRPLPANRAQAVADLYFAMQNGELAATTMGGPQKRQ
jgi:hypothetical protein